MTESHRLAEGGGVDRSAPVHFTFDGRSYTGLQGDTLASALLASHVHFVARSWKYHRPRGILTAGVEEPNALVQLERGAYTIPNARATEVELYEGLNATSINARPSLAHDRMAIAQRFARFLAAGFYYKTFMWPPSWWRKYYEVRIRDAAGLGVAPTEPDPGRYDKRFAHCDVLVVGAGPAGLVAACTAGRAGARVILIDNGREAGGSLLAGDQSIDGGPASKWIAERVSELASQTDTLLLLRTTAYGYHDQQFVTACERLTDHLPPGARRGVRERVWKIRARHVVLATGAHERPLVFGNNDLPGVMLASAASAYIYRYAVLPGHSSVVFTNNDSGYQCAIDLKHRSSEVTVIDPRRSSNGSLPNIARKLGVRIVEGAIVATAHGDTHVRRVTLRGYNAARHGGPENLPCDLLAVSGGWNPAVHLFAQSGGKLRWDDARACFVPDVPAQAQTSAGAANGDFTLQEALDGGARAGITASTGAVGTHAIAMPAFAAPREDTTPILPLWMVGDAREAARGPKQFIDYQNDVTVADIFLSVSEGYRSIEHVKRYTALGFGTDQGKLGNVNGAAVLAGALGRAISEVGTTTFRPNYTPVSFGAIAGRELGEYFRPIRKTCLYDWNVANGAVFVDAGDWKRAWYYPHPGEDMEEAVARECLAVRNSVGLLDYCTIGKIEVRGPDAAEFLNRMYINSWTKLQSGRCRYGILLDENGMVLDDGVNIRLADQHFLLTTTTGGAGRVLAWMEQWLQTEWRDLRVFVTSVSDQYATITLAGPNARHVISAVCEDIDFSREAFPFMTFRVGSVDRIPTRVQRVSFSGELSYELYVPAGAGRRICELLMQAGERYGITPYGTEAMDLLRAEKGFIIVGQDTDGSVTPVDLGMEKLIGKRKDFIGKRSLSRSYMLNPDRKQLVGLLADDPKYRLPEGGQILIRPSREATAPMLGHVTSSFISPTLDRSIALALVKAGRSKMGEDVTVATSEEQFIRAKVCSPVFYDPEGARQNVE